MSFREPSFSMMAYKNQIEGNMIIALGIVKGEPRDGVGKGLNCRDMN